MEAFINNFSISLANYVHQLNFIALDVQNEIKAMLEHIRSIQSLLEDAEQRKFHEPYIKLWLLELKDAIYDAHYTINLCGDVGAKLFENKKPDFITTKLCCNVSSALDRLAHISLRHDMRNRIKEQNVRLNQIYIDGKEYELQESTKSKPLQITGVDFCQTSSLIDHLVVGREVDVAANELVNLLITEKVEEKCRVFAITGMEGMGKTALAQKNFNHQEIKNYFDVKAWACVAQIYSQIDLLKLIISETKGSYTDANTKSELESILRDSVASCQSFFLVLDYMWRANMWIDCLQAPLENANVSVRVLVTTRNENVAKYMKAARIHPVKKLSIKTSWEMLCMLIFSHGEEELAYGLKELGFQILEKCEGDPLKILFVARVLRKKEFTRNAWQNVLGSISNSLPECRIR